MHTEHSLIHRERHIRALWYFAISLGLALVGYAFLGFDQWQTAGYAVSCFIMLHVVNFRAMFARLASSSQNERPSLQQ